MFHVKCCKAYPVIVQTNIIEGFLYRKNPTIKMDKNTTE